MFKANSTKCGLSLMSGHFLQVTEFQRVDGHFNQLVELLLRDFQISASKSSRMLPPPSPGSLSFSINPQIPEREGSVNKGQKVGRNAI